MSAQVITVENVSKSYLVGHRTAATYTALRDVIAQEFKKIGHKVIDLARGRQILHGDTVEEFWALKDVNFEVTRGEIIGIVGRNGAGKSTLLKILSRITEPTTGRITLKGRVASLLEVGTGFHPELTGRENIFLNGAILGMTQREIGKRFDEIVDFAEVERFLDTPVKRYSSGMYVRLAFSVAAHLDPEILLIDEVLAVGDSAFQKKCLGKMESVTAGGGRTVIFISHNTTALLSLCRRGVLLERGQVSLQGSMKEVVDQYSLNEVMLDANFVPNRSKPSIERVTMDEVALKAGDIVIDIHYSSPFPLEPPVPAVAINSSFGNPIYGSNSRTHNIMGSGVQLREGIARFRASRPPLARGHYTISVWLRDLVDEYDHKWDALRFDFVPFDDTPERESMPLEEIGHVRWPAEWCLL
jgi:lipopolysaccharide transport system ATP-binding protein